MAEHESSAVQLHAAEYVSGGDHRDISGADIDPVPDYVDERQSRDSIVSDGEEPTDEERHQLRHVSDKLPKAAWLVAVVELCERFAFYGLSGPFQNYIQNGRHGAVPGALGRGQSGATGLTNFFQFWCYVTPIIGAIIADQYLGKYNTIVYFAMVYIVGLVVLLVTSLPVSLEHGAGLGGLIAAMIIIGLGTGGIKSNVSPLIAEQYRGTKQTIKTLRSGERVIVDPAVTIQRIYMIFYLCINIGSLSAIATTELELHIDFWAAYLLPTLMFLVGFVVVIAGKKYYVVRPPKGSIIIHAFKAMWIGLVNKGNMNAAKPSYQQEYGGKHKTPWNDQFIEEIKRALVACKVFVFFPIYWVVYSQMLNNFISQAGTMQLHGIPNDIMQNIDPLTIIIFIPIFDRLIYPFLRKVGIPFRPITRITFGFLTGALAMAYAAIVQHLIYNAAPCYNSPLKCDASGDGTLPNHVHVAVQTPAYLLIGVSEIFASITGLEYAFTKAPPSMKSFVMSMFLLTTAFGSALGIALSPTAKDPKLVWMYAGLAIAAGISGTVFWLIYHKYNDTEEEMNKLEHQGEVARPVTEVTGIRRHSEYHHGEKEPEV
ncbi:MAG: peptide transporter ptr2 [Geoglossum simile]|nr:MAG: peptide transporter ptr2 [Geoglossum simile]